MHLGRSKRDVDMFMPVLVFSLFVDCWIVWWFHCSGSVNLNVTYDITILRFACFSGTNDD